MANIVLSTPDTIKCIESISFDSFLCQSRTVLSSGLESKDIFLKITRKGICLFDARLMDFIYYNELCQMYLNANHLRFHDLINTRSSFRKIVDDHPISDTCYMFIVENCGLYNDCVVEITNRSSVVFEIEFINSGKSSPVDYALIVESVIFGERYSVLGYDSISYGIWDGNGNSSKYDLFQSYTVDGFVELVVDDSRSLPSMSHSYIPMFGLCYFRNQKSLSFKPMTFENYSCSALKVVTKQKIN